VRELGGGNRTPGVSSPATGDNPGIRLRALLGKYPAAAQPGESDPQPAEQDESKADGCQP